MRNAQKIASVLLAVLFVAVGFSQSVRAQETIKLPAPEMSGGMPLMDALAKRQSTRLFGDQNLSPQQISNRLWAAFGINRPESGGRTAPSWRGSNEIDIYIAMPDAVRVYDAKAHELRAVFGGDIRSGSANFPFVRNAPVVLIYVADRTRMAKASDEDHIQNAHVDAAIIAQNVYLFAASAGLGTVILGNVDRKSLSQTLKLRDNQILTYSQPVGHPK
ncbi:MAG TPA: SagB/ThcOx family dehydrogenase [Candidatus Limnocylindria bacterium]|nr:SagB/ThcOx family dehydrogenase [Candidatus Limnocylindria bacterium]